MVTPGRDARYAAISGEVELLESSFGGVTLSIGWRSKHLTDFPAAESCCTASRPNRPVAPVTATCAVNFKGAEADIVNAAAVGRTRRHRAREKLANGARCKLCARCWICCTPRLLCDTAQSLMSPSSGSRMNEDARAEVCPVSSYKGPKRLRYFDETECTFNLVVSQTRGYSCSGMVIPVQDS